MGTTYSVKFIEENIDSSYIHSSIDSILNQIIIPKEMGIIVRTAGII